MRSRKCKKCKASRNRSVRHLSSCLCNLSCGINIAVALQQNTTTIHQFHSAKMHSTSLQSAKLHCYTSTQCFMLPLIPCSPAAPSCTSYTSLLCILHHYWCTVCHCNIAMHHILTIFKLNIYPHMCGIRCTNIWSMLVLIHQCSV